MILATKFYETIKDHDRQTVLNQFYLKERSIVMNLLLHKRVKIAYVAPNNDCNCVIFDTNGIYGDPVTILKEVLKTYCYVIIKDITSSNENLILYKKLKALNPSIGPEITVGFEVGLPKQTD